MNDTKPAPVRRDEALVVLAGALPALPSHGWAVEFIDLGDNAGLIESRLGEDAAFLTVLAGADALADAKLVPAACRDAPRHP
jgi:hypothetical protein